MTRKVKKSKTTLATVPVTFLLKRGDKFYLIPDNMIETLSIDEAFRLGLVAHIEQRRQLLEDISKGEHFIENVSVVSGLETSLSKLEKMFPSIRKQIVEFDKKYHSKVGRC
jgi:hypothetical protein